VRARGGKSIDGPDLVTTRVKMDLILECSVVLVDIMTHVEVWWQMYFIDKQY